MPVRSWTTVNDNRKETLVRPRATNAANPFTLESVPRGRTSPPSSPLSITRTLVIANPDELHKDLTVARTYLSVDHDLVVTFT